MAAVEFHHIAKSFGAVAALRDVTFSVDAGEAHAIVGENGAGKSTLLKILAGGLRPDRGELRVGSQPAALHGARDALARGIGFVHQEMLAFPHLSVAANIYAGREITGRFGLLRESEMRARAGELLARLHVPIAPDTRVAGLPPAYRQLLQVARALAFDCRILALDEPTTSLTSRETDHLFQVLASLKRAGVTLIYVSHRLPEVFQLCDRVTVLRDGAHVKTAATRDISHDDVVQAMVGRAIPPRTAPVRAPGGGTVLELEDLSRPPCFERVSLGVAAGEIVGMFGLVGSGRTELLETIAGLHAATAGAVRLGGRVHAFRSPREAARAGVALVPEDRQHEGLFFNLSLRHNLVLPRAEARGAILVGGDEPALAGELQRRCRIRGASLESRPGTLSGGNQQKVVLAKWLALDVRVLLLDEPTKGVDVGAKYEIHAMIRELASRGTACLLVSSDLPEVLAVADRILVMRNGRICGELAANDADEERVMRMAATDPGAAA